MCRFFFGVFISDQKYLRDSAAGTISVSGASSRPGLLSGEDVTYKVRFRGSDSFSANKLLPEPPFIKDHLMENIFDRLFNHSVTSTHYSPPLNQSYDVL
ncbi:hypothetical protein GGU45_001120 [Niabella hirudinis]